MLFLEDSFTFSYRLVGLLVEERRNDDCFGLGKLILSESLIVCSVEGEVEDLVPARVLALVRVCGLQDGVLLVILHLDFDIGLHLGHAGELFLRLGSSVLAIIFNLVILIEAWIARQRLRHIGSWPVCSAQSLVRVLLLDSFVIFDQILPDWYILSFDDMNHDAQCFNSFQILGWLLPDQRLELSATHEELFADCHQKVRIIFELFLIND